eukprot:jgi/Bigna1/62125/fgenesh1_kg.30_\
MVGLRGSRRPQENKNQLVLGILSGHFRLLILRLAMCNRSRVKEARAYFNGDFFPRTLIPF